MECPYCGRIDNKVIDSRLTQERSSVRRRRLCLGCSKLKDRTGFDDKKTRNIIYRLRKQGKIKRKRRGVYIVE
jgi:transcriptional regulator NrdR family protein